MTSAEYPDLELFRARYVFAILDDGGMAVDLRTGTYCALNRTAAAMCAVVKSAESWEAASEAIGRRWRLPLPDAESALQSLVRNLSLEHRPPSWKEDFAYRKVDGGYILFDQEQPILEVDTCRRVIRRAGPAGHVRFSLPNYVRLIGSKLLPLLGVPVLHAAACSTPRGLVVFCGRSGAGKSTTARLLAANGYPVVSDEILVISHHGSAVRAHPASERSVHTWCSDVGQLLTANAELEVPYEPIRDAACGPEENLSTLVFIGVERRRGTTIETETLAPAAVLEQLMGVSFLGALDRGFLASFLDHCRAIATATKGELAWMPDGLEPLKQALPAYITKTVS